MTNADVRDEARSDSENASMSAAARATSSEARDDVGGSDMVDRTGGGVKSITSLSHTAPFQRRITRKGVSEKEPATAVAGVVSFTRPG